MNPLEFWLAAKWAPLFSAGICFYLLSARGRSPRRLILIAVSYLLALVYEVGPNLRGSQVAPDLVSAWVGGVAITAFYTLFFWIAGGRRQFKPSSMSVWAGLMTYPVYMLHQNIGYVLLETLAPSGLPFGLRLLFVGSTVAVLAWIIVSYVEKPLAPRLRRLLSPPRSKGPNADPRSNPASF